MLKTRFSLIVIKNKIIVILGPTSSGKSDVAIKLARRFGGEVISADSRQVYRGMDIGTGKVEPDRLGEIPIKFAKSKFSSGSHPFISGGIPHYMINIVSPNTDYNVAKFKKAADKIIADILKRGKLPIICGGTGFWIKAVADNVNFPAVKPDKVLRSKLRNKSADTLFKMLKKLDSRRARNIDKNNKVRLIRAIEICKTLGRVPALPRFDHASRFNLGTAKGCSRVEPFKLEVEPLTSYDFLQIGIKLPKEKLHQNIKKRLNARFKFGMIKEVKDLHFKHSVSWKRLESFGLEYKWIALYLQNEMTGQEMEKKLLQEIKNYSKRQMTWFQKDARIIWLDNYKKMEDSTNKFIKK